MIRQITRDSRLAAVRGAHSAFCVAKSQTLDSDQLKRVWTEVRMWRNYHVRTSAIVANVCKDFITKIPHAAIASQFNDRYTVTH